MEFLSWLPKFIAELGYTLFSKKQDSDSTQKEKFAALIDRIADCTYEIGNAIQNGEHLPAQCSELSTYLKEIKVLAEEITDLKTAEQLTYWLYHVEAFPGVAKLDLESELIYATRPSWFKAKRFSQGSKVLEISGTLKAVANLLRV